jgi:hypothetical protein
MRHCGTCTACCMAMEVSELHKPVYCTCEHCGAGACGIYDKRPQACRDFTCFWLRGHLGETDRPDRIGLIFTMRHRSGFGMVPMLVECIPGAAQTAPALAVIAQLAGEMPVMVLTPDDLRTYGQPEHAPDR